MEVSTCSHRKILVPCSLPWYTYELDPYIGCEHRCRYCYALNNAETDWEKEIQIHADISGQLRQEMASLETQIIYIGMNSDPYQPSEATLYQTRKALEICAEREFPVCILTKSGLVTRDIDLLMEMPVHSVGVSIAFNNEHSRKLFEPKAPSTDERIYALKKVKDANIHTYTMICPVMPLITDVVPLIELCAPYSDTIWVYSLRIDSENDKNWHEIHPILERYFPGIAGQYRKILFSEKHNYWESMKENLAEIQKQTDVRLEIHL
jgi:DNA repair photolyase